jgi:hypothetical protein
MACGLCYFVYGSWFRLCRLGFRAQGIRGSVILISTPPSWSLCRMSMPLRRSRVPHVASPTVLEFRI